MKYLVDHDGTLVMAGQNNLPNVVARLLNEYVEKHGRLSPHLPIVYEIGKQLKYKTRTEVEFNP